MAEAGGTWRTWVGEALVSIITLLVATILPKRWLVLVLALGAVVACAVLVRTSTWTGEVFAKRVVKVSVAGLLALLVAIGAAWATWPKSRSWDVSIPGEEATDVSGIVQRVGLTDEQYGGRYFLFPDIVITNRGNRAVTLSAELRLQGNHEVVAERPDFGHPSLDSWPGLDSFAAGAPTSKAETHLHFPLRIAANSVVEGWVGFIVSKYELGLLKQPGCYDFGAAVVFVDRLTQQSITAFHEAPFCRAEVTPKLPTTR